MARVSVVLSGDAPQYPLEIPISVSGDVDDLDFSLEHNKIIIASGTTGYIDIRLNADFQVEGDESLIVSFKQGVNAGVNNLHQITISENNLVPTVDVEFRQNGKLVSYIAKGEGEVEISLTINDSNLNDTHIIDWNLPEFLAIEISANQLKLFLDPQQTVLPETEGNLISFSVVITDSGEGQLSQTEFFNIPLLENAPRLDNSDTDRDGLPDNEEGFEDEDHDGLPAYLDNSTIPYLQQLHVNAAAVKLVETEPGLHLNLGKFARLQFSDGIQLSQQEIENTTLIENDSLVHQNAFFDFEIKNIKPFGRSVQIVIPLFDIIPEHAVYRKFSQTNGWSDFSEDGKNTLYSSMTVNGVCPSPTSDLYTPGLTAGNECLRLTIEDGGINDADLIANGTIDDPGGLAVISNKELTKESDPVQSSSGGSINFYILCLLMLFLRSKIVVKLVKN